MILRASGEAIWSRESADKRRGERFDTLCMRQDADAFLAVLEASGRGTP